MEEGPISWMMIDDYCQRVGLDPDQTEDMHLYIRRMDDAYRKFQSSKREKSKGKQPPPAKRPPRTKGGK